MIVCKFFQQGYCRYGQNCRFEHVYGSKYTYHATTPQPVVTNTEHTDEQLVNQVQTDVKSVLHGSQWILSCYAPYKEKPIIPGIHDLSPEEMRLFIYESKRNNTLEQAIAYINNLTRETRQKYEQLLQPTPHLIKVLRSIMQYKEGQTVLSPFTATQSGSGAATSVFRSAVQSSVFTQNNPTPSIFSQNNPQNMFDNGATNNMFAQNSTQLGITDAGAKSIFAQANQNVFAQNQTNVFSNTNQNLQNPSNIFASANQNLFKQNDTQGSPFQLNISQQNMDTNTFQKSNTQQSFFGQKVPSVEQSGVYSKMEELTPDDLEAFKSDKFQLGFVPEIAPPQELCNN